MNKRNKELAKEARLLTGWPVGEVEFQKFAELVRADEREACAQLCERHACTSECSSYGLGSNCEFVIAKEIRARGEK